jgi:hypothetical protein
VLIERGPLVQRIELLMILISGIGNDDASTESVLSFIKQFPCFVSSKRGERLRSV